MKNFIIVITLLMALIVTCYILKDSKINQRQNPLSKQKSVLEGILVNNPKYFFHYYIQSESTKHECAILNTEPIKDILPGSYIRAIGDIKSILDYKGYPNNIANYSASWIYMDIDEIIILRQPENTLKQNESKVVTTKSLNQLPVIQMSLYGDLGGRRINDFIKLQDVNNVIILNNGTSAPSEIHLSTIEGILKQNPEIRSFYYIDSDNGQRTRSHESEIHGFFTVLLQTENDCIGFDIDGEKVRIFNGIGDGWIKR